MSECEGVFQGRKNYRIVGRFRIRAVPEKQISTLLGQPLRLGRS
jgi:hypothetical protein